MGIHGDLSGGTNALGRVLGHETIPNYCICTQDFVHLQVKISGQINTPKFP